MELNHLSVDGSDMDVIEVYLTVLYEHFSTIQCHLQLDATADNLQ